jgi:hypothetical protein
MIGTGTAHAIGTRTNEWTIRIGAIGTRLTVTIVEETHRTFVNVDAHVLDVVVTLSTVTLETAHCIGTGGQYIACMCTQITLVNIIACDAITIITGITLACEWAVSVNATGIVSITIINRISTFILIVARFAITGETGVALAIERTKWVDTSCIGWTCMGFDETLVYVQTLFAILILLIPSFTATLVTADCIRADAIVDGTIMRIQITLVNIITCDAITIVAIVADAGETAFIIDTSGINIAIVQTKETFVQIETHGSTATVA